MPAEGIGLSTGELLQHRPSRYTPWISLTTDASLIVADSNVFWSRWVLRVRSLINDVRYRVRSRRCRSKAGGPKLAFNRPCCSRSAIHSASPTSVLRPGTAFRCCAWTTNNSKRPSRMFYTGFPIHARAFHRYVRASRRFQPFRHRLQLRPLSSPTAAAVSRFPAAADRPRSSSCERPIHSNTHTRISW